MHDGENEALVAESLNWEIRQYGYSSIYSKQFVGIIK